MPFEITPFIIYLSREQSRTRPDVPAVATESNASTGDSVESVGPGADTK